MTRSNEPAAVSEAASTHERVEKTLAFYDLSGFLKLTRGMSDAEMAAFLDRFYHAAGSAVSDSGGCIVKHLGDAVLLSWPADTAMDAVVESFHALQRVLDGPGFPDGTKIRGCVHAANVVEGRFGPDGLADVMGADVTTLFRMSSGRGLALSEKAYRRLPSGARTPFRKQSAPTVYVS